MLLSVLVPGTVVPILASQALAGLTCILSAPYRLNDCNDKERQASVVSYEQHWRLKWRATCCCYALTMTRQYNGHIGYISELRRQFDASDTISCHCAGEPHAWGRPSV